MTNRRSLLLIEDDKVLGPALMQRLRLEGFVVRLAENAAVANRELRRNPPDIVISDIRLPDASGEDVFRGMLETIGLRPVFFMTAFGEVDQAVRLIKAGARDYLTKPVNADALVARIRSELAHQDAVRSCEDAPPLGNSPQMLHVEKLLRKAGPFDLPVLLRGETGVGKEVAARRLHGLSAREKEPFVAVNCAAIPSNLTESTLFGHEKGAFTGAHARQVGLAARAGEGTLFLDEIGELPLEQQPALLRLLQERRFTPVGGTREEEFRARIVTATNADLAARVAERTFREDLYFRLSVVEILIPPLRQRPDDIIPLAGRLLAEAVRRLGVTDRHISQHAMSALSNHAWPGNVRELRNRIERAVVLAEAPQIEIDDLFPEGLLDTQRLAPGAKDLPVLEDAARAAIRSRVQDALARTNGNQTEAARLLGVSRTTIWKYSR